MGFVTAAAAAATAAVLAAAAAAVDRRDNYTLGVDTARTDSVRPVLQ